MAMPEMLPAYPDGRKADRGRATVLYNSPVNEEADQHMQEKATFAAGCFWGVEHTFRELEGVSDAVSGYTGGTAEQPTYKQVCAGRTGHAEAVEVTFDPEVVSYDQLLAHFWSIHNPTTRDRQGFDVGSQYRSAIFTHSDEQRRAAEASRDAAQTHLNREIVTQIEPAATFWPAEDYHQRYVEKNGREVCKITAPKPVEPAAEPAAQGGFLSRLRG
jgi:peptide-methionine (S)-S-oxide reductase